MYRGTPYLNKHIKRLQEQRSMQFHLANLTHIRPRTGTLQYTGDVHINKKKGQMQKEARFTQIERQNRILLQKISSIMGKQTTKNARRTESQQKVNRSLNSELRKRQLQNIQVQNAKLLKRLQQKRPNYETEKFHESWKKQKYVIKNLSNYPFIISDKKKKRSSVSQIGGRDSKTNTIQLCRMREIDGVNFLITIRLNNQRLQIIGDTKDKKQIKVIQIQRKEAVQFIQQECSGKIQRIFDCLRYDKVDQVMYLVASEVQMEDAKNNQIKIKNKKEDNPQFDIDDQNQRQIEENQQNQNQQFQEGQIPIRVTNGSESKKYWIQVQNKKNQNHLQVTQNIDGNREKQIPNKESEQQQINQQKDDQRKNLKTNQGKRKSQRNQSRNNTNYKDDVFQQKKIQQQKQALIKDSKTSIKNQIIIQSQVVKQNKDVYNSIKSPQKIQKKQQIKQILKQEKNQEDINDIQNEQEQIIDGSPQIKQNNYEQEANQEFLQNQEIIEEGDNKNDQGQQNYQEQIIEEGDSQEKK